MFLVCDPLSMLSRDSSANSQTFNFSNVTDLFILFRCSKKDLLNYKLLLITHGLKYSVVVPDFRSTENSWGKKNGHVLQDPTLNVGLQVFCTKYSVSASLALIMWDIYSYNSSVLLTANFCKILCSADHPKAHKSGSALLLTCSVRRP